MRTNDDESLDEQEKELARTLNRLLADEYILMNKTSTCIYKITAQGFEQVPQVIYEELKAIVQEITSLLKKRKQAALTSINDILNNTRLSNHIDLSSKANQYSVLISDHGSIAANIEKELGFSSIKLDEEVKSLLYQIKECHQSMEERLNSYFGWCINNYKRQTA